MKTFSVSAAIIVALSIGFIFDLTEVSSKHEPRRTVVTSARINSARVLTMLSNTYTGGGYHSYGRQTIDLTARSGLVTLTFYVAAAPNRFTYYTSSGSFINTSDWVGEANYQGPWGSSLQQGPNTFYYSFTGGYSYGIDVETITDPNVGTRINDYWEIDY